jgi:hypothetical protein
MTAIHYSRGRNKFDAEPIIKTAPSFVEFRESVLSDRAKKKGLQYITGPFKVNGDGKSHRCLEDHLPRRFVPFDYDYIADAETFGALILFLQRYSGFVYTTASSTKTAPRARAVLESTRDMTAEEGERVCLAIERLIDAECGAGTIKYDRSVYGYAQPLYCPPVESDTYKFDGVPVDVDTVLLTAPPATPRGTNKVERLDEALRGDPVARVLDDMGMVKSRRQDGAINVICPCSSEHSSTSGESTTIYYLPHTGGFKTGRFVCQHEHCRTRQQDSFLAALGITNVVNIESKQPEDTTKNQEPLGLLQHFQPLGYDGDQFFFFTSRGKQIRSMSAAKLGKKIELLTLAPLDWWEREYGTDEGFSGRRVEMAANHIIQACYSKGVFSKDSKRGRGVWIDKNRVVIHAGDRLYIDGNETHLLQTDTAHVYEQSKPVAISISDPLPTSEAKKFLAFCRALHWESSTYGYLIAGFVVVSIASGALRWRPHGLLTGPKGCGKSWIMDVFVHILGSFCLAATGGTSAAGLRQSLQSDALPVLFDEAEGDSGRAADNIAAVLSLMRHSSAALEAKVYKGGSDGHASASIVRSCFLLASIRDPLIQAADKSRVTVFNLKASSRESATHWKTVLVPLANSLMAQDYAERLRGRVFANIVTLLEAINVFSDACSERFGDRRMGDQIGAMLGGVWLLTEDGVPTEAEATRRVGMMRWEDQTETLEEASDEEACFAAILSAHVRVDGDGWHGEASIAGLIHEVRFPGASEEHFTDRDAKRTLAMYGIRVDVDAGVLYVSNSDSMLQRKIMAHTAWPQGWGKLLARLTGATKPKTSMKIGGSQTRVTAILLQ